LFLPILEVVGWSVVPKGEAEGWWIEEAAEASGREYRW